MGITTTPFVGQDDFVFVEEKNVKQNKVFKDCSVSLIDNLVKEEILSDIDLKILELLKDYTYLNYYAIDKLLKASGNVYGKDNYQSNLKNMRCYGIVLMYRNNNDVCVYTLSQGGYIYESLKRGLKVARRKDFFENNISGNLINHTLSVNSAILGLIEQDSDKKIRLYDSKDFSMYRFFAIGEGKSKLKFAVVSVRRGDSYAFVITGCVGRAINVFGSNDFILLLCCEDQLHIIEAAEELNKGVPIIASSVYFTADNIAKEDLMEAIFTIKQDDEGKMSAALCKI
ncbi:MAG: hypothetical protein K6G88_08340 [Lachnospiraceae bacterium]|nr:hypothetical protein [Lachnospiraceae bacterium]